MMAVPAPRTRRPSLPSSLLQPFTKQAYAGPPPSRSQGAASASAKHVAPAVPLEAHTSHSNGSSLSLSELASSAQTHAWGGHGRNRSRRVVGWMRSKFRPTSPSPPLPASPTPKALPAPDDAEHYTQPRLELQQDSDSKPLPRLPPTATAPPVLPSPRLQTQPASEWGALPAAPARSPVPSESKIMAQVRAEQARQEEEKKAKARQFERERLAARREARKVRPPSPGTDAYGATSYLKRYEGSPRSRGLQLMAQQDRLRQSTRT